MYTKSLLLYKNTYLSQGVDILCIDNDACNLIEELYNKASRGNAIVLRPFFRACMFWTVPMNDMHDVDTSFSRSKPFCN